MTGAITDIVNEYDDIKVYFYDWYKMPKTQKALKAVSEIVDHANWAENYDFTRVAKMPDKVKEYVELDTFFVNSKKLRRKLKDGSRGGVYSVANEKMEHILQTAVAEFREILVQI